MSELQGLSEKSVRILGLIADGHTSSHIVDSNDDVEYRDISSAAGEALNLNASATLSYQERLARIRAQYPRAYEPWTAEDDSTLIDMHEAGTSVDVLAAHFQRRPSAIRSRLDKLSSSPWAP